MKKIMKVTQGKRFLSLILAVVMIATVFNMALPMLKLDASAAGSITTADGETITQTRVVSGYETTYENYATQYLNGASKPTNIVIPGLDPAQDYVIQGMTYYPKRDWMLVTAYHNAADGETVQSSKVFALDAATGDFVAMFSFINPNGTTVNTDHGGGIAVSEHNIYYACGDQDRKIAYAPLSVLENAPLNTHTQIQLVAERDFVEVGSISSNSKTAYTAYVCYDDGILWTGNFYDPGADLIGINIAATDYNASSNNTYRSMVFGYKLKGNSSQEEWNNLVASTGADRQGNPSYAIGLNNAIKDVQYAVVDNGKLYLSRSFGSGAGNSVTFGFGETSILTVADIDLSQPGTVPVKISTTSTGSLDKEIKVHEISAYKDYEMMPMSEGLCFIDDQLFITFEGASNKYLNESSGLTAIGNCEKPIDVIWQLDPYELMNIEAADQNTSIYYERIYSESELKTGEEYIILHESEGIDPATQNNYLYALNAKGNFNGMELSKSSNIEANVVGYDAMIGHPISYYSVEEVEKDGKTVERLYITNPEVDDVENVRWTIEKISGTNYYIKNTSTYFADYKSLYFNYDKISMAANGSEYLKSMNIGQINPGNGYFYLSNGGSSYLWCNDGLNESRNAKINAFYSSNAANYPILDGVTEVPGTFHTDGLNQQTNIINSAIANDNAEIPYKDAAFKIYRRVFDGSASTYESRVYTNLKAELQADGTYNVMLDTYAISPNHYQYVGERPTDYIIVADVSYSMSKGGSAGISKYTGGLGVSSMSLESHTADDQPDGVIGYAFYSNTEDIRFKHTDGKYYKAYMAIRNTWSSSTKQYYYVYYIADDGYYYCYTNQNKDPMLKYTEPEFKAWVAGTNGVLQTASSGRSSNDPLIGDGRRDEVLFEAEHYRYDNINSTYAGDHNSIDGLKITAQDLVDKIAAQNSNNRIALVQYGSSTSYLGSGGWATSGFTDAFWTAGANASNLKNQISNISVAPQTSNDGLELSIANSIITNSGVNYKAGGPRNVAVIFLSDGMPGNENPGSKTEGCGNNQTTVFDGNITFTLNDSTTAANKVISTAKTMKDNGAFIYTVLYGKNNVDGFAKKTYMDAVSSKYPAATSMSNLGGQSVDGVRYAMDFATCSCESFFDFGNIACREVAVNNSVGLDNLDANSYLRGVLGDAFKFPENGDYSVETQFVPGEYDEIGRFEFKEAKPATGVTTNIDIPTKTITVTGYDYSTQYISKEKENGNALRIIITGLLANKDADIENADVNITGETGVYKTAAKMNSNEAFKGFPTDHISIPKYTYVLDYGIQMLDTDVNGTLKSVSPDLTAQRDANGNLAYNSASPDGLVEIADNSLDLLYTTTPTTTTDSGYVLIQRDDGTYDWFEIEVVPASNVYYEEDEIVTSGTTGKIEWEQEGTTEGAYRNLATEDDPYGYDAYYDTTSPFSNNSYLKVDVTSEKGNTTSKKKSFEFTGTGIDIMSACGKNTGILSIGIKKYDEETQKLKTVKSFMVDTYYDDANVSSLISQVPIVSWSNVDDNNKLVHGTYTVDIAAVYVATAGGAKKSVAKNNLIDTGLVMNSAEPADTADIAAILKSAGMDDMIADDMELIWFDDNSIFNGGTGVAPTVKKTREGEKTGVVTLENYIDGFRVYNPLGANSDAYKDSENNANYVNVLDNLMDSSSNVGVFGYIVSGQNNELTWADYETVGPQSEVYLNKGQSINFNVTVDQAEKVMLGLRAVSGPTSVTIANSNNQAYKVENVPIKSATEMYYDITPCFGNVTGNDQIIKITITNANGGILAVNHVKHSGGNGLVGDITTRSVARSATTTEGLLFAPLTQDDLINVQNSMNLPGVQGIVKNGVVLPLVEEEEDIIPDDNVTPDVPEDDTTGDDVTTPDIPEDDTTNDDTTTDSGEFSIFSLLEMLISLIEKILYGAFGAGSLF